MHRDFKTSQIENVINKVKQLLLEEDKKSQYSEVIIDKFNFWLIQPLHYVK